MTRFMVPFGTNPEDFQFTKGTIIIYDTFNKLNEKKIDKAIKLALDRDFDKIILYPLHEKTCSRMNIDLVTSYKDRLRELESIVSSKKTNVFIEICKLEGKRRKYTPIDFALNFISEYNKGPYFLWVSDNIANTISTFATFDKIIKDYRFMIERDTNEKISKKLEQNNKRWEWI